MSDYFPPEVIEKILFKLPAKSLIRFTSVCKSWRSIITSPYFVSSYLYKPKNETLLLRRFDDEQEHYSLLEVSKNRPFTIHSSSQLEFPLKPWHEPYFTIVGFCRGVLCLSDDFYSPNKPTPLVLCNPCIKKHFVLPNPRPLDYVLGLGFGVARDDLKVVRFFVLPGTGDDDDDVTEAEVFSLREGRWRRLEVNVRVRSLGYLYSHVFLNGAMHWIGKGYNLVTEVEEVSIVLFHVAQEVFDEIELPKGLPVSDGCLNPIYSFGELQSLAVIGFQVDLSCEVWLMKEYGDEGSWTRLYSFEFQLGIETIAALRDNGEALVGRSVLGALESALTGTDEEDGFFTLDFENLEAKNHGIRGVKDLFYIENYVESLELLLTGESGDLQDLSEDEEEDLM